VVLRCAPRRAPAPPRRLHVPRRRPVRVSDRASDPTHQPARRRGQGPRSAPRTRRSTSPITAARAAASSTSASDERRAGAADLVQPCVSSPRALDEGVRLGVLCCCAAVVLTLVLVGRNLEAASTDYLGGVTQHGDTALLCRIKFAAGGLPKAGGVRSGGFSKGFRRGRCGRWLTGWCGFGSSSDSSSSSKGTRCG